MNLSIMFIGFSFFNITNFKDLYTNNKIENYVNANENEKDYYLKMSKFHIIT